MFAYLSEIFPACFVGFSEYSALLLSPGIPFMDGCANDPVGIPH